MCRTPKRLVLGVAVLAAVTAGRDAAAQGTRSNPAAASNAGPMLNPYMSPYANPYLNPALTVGSTNRNDALLYLWAAQQQPGGLLGGPAVPPGTGSSRTRSSAANVGGGASRYFQRGSATRSGASSAGRFQDHGRYYGKNGR